MVTARAFAVMQVLSGVPMLKVSSESEAIGTQAMLWGASKVTSTSLWRTTSQPPPYQIKSLLYTVIRKEKGITIAQKGTAPNKRPL